MTVLPWIFLTPLVLLSVIALVLTLSYLASLDWHRGHRTATSRLPQAEDSTADGLVAIEHGGFRFRARVANLHGEGEALILLHGFPQTSAAWEPLIGPAAAAGYRVIAVDQRGYSPGARPRGRDNYTLDKLIGDVLGVADALGVERFHLVGHDWGAAVGWGVVMSAPQRIRSWTALSIAHSAAFFEAVRTDADQRRRSRYFLLFRTPVLAELVLGFHRLLIVRRLMYRRLPAEQVAEYLGVLREPGALTAALNWYRAVGRGGTSRLPPNVDRPVLFIWGNRDPAAGRRAVELQERYIEGDYEKIELDAGHWLMETRTAEVVPAILRHLRRH